MWRIYRNREGDAGELFLESGASVCLRRNALFLCAFALIFLCVFSGMQYSSAASTPSFADVSPDSAAYPYAGFLSAKGIIKGYPDGTFRPYGPITRAEMAAVLARTSGLSGYRPVSPTFKDVNPSYWAYATIEAAARSGLIKGYPDGTFRPQAVVRRAELAALLFRLTKEKSSDAVLPSEIKDVPRNYWAAKQIAAALDSGMMGLVSKNSFAPAQPATRAQAAKGLGVVLTLAPEHRAVIMAAELVPVKGDITVVSDEKGQQKITKAITCGKGTIIKTGANGEANLKFADGSSILLKPNTELNIVEAKGQTVIKKDGSPGATVDNLEVKLTKGKIFGALATAYFFQRQEQEKKAGNNQETKLKTGKDEQEEMPWWKEASAKRVRVKVDMPWGVAGIRGTFWSNEVSEHGQSTSVVDGEALVTAGGITIKVSEGQMATIPSPGAPPAPPAAMPAAEEQAWQQVQAWVQETAQAIENNTPVVETPFQIEQFTAQPALPEQPQSVQRWQPQTQTLSTAPTATSIAAGIMQSFNQATSGAGTPVTTTPTSNTSSSGEDGASSGTDVTAPAVSFTVPEDGSGSVPTLVAQFTSGEQSYVRNGESYSMGTAALAQDERLFVPVQYAADGLGADFYWDQQHQSIRFYDGYRNVVMSLGSTVMDVDGDETQMDAAPFQDGVTWVPIYWVAYGLGYNVFEYGNGSYDWVFVNEICVDFSEKIQEGSTSSQISLKENNSEVTITKRVIDNHLLIIPDSGLVPDTQYVVTVPFGAVQDLAGNSFAGISYSFITRSPRLSWSVDTLMQFADPGIGAARLALDSNGDPHIISLDPFGNYEYRVGVKTDSGWNWNWTVVDTVYQPWSGLAQPLSISVGSDNIRRFVYARDSGLVYATFDGSDWVSETVYDEVSVSNVEFADLVLDTDNNPYILFYSLPTGLRLAYKSGGSWVTKLVDDDGSIVDEDGNRAALAIDGSGRLHVAYHDLSSNSLVYAWRDIGDENGNWVYETVYTTEDGTGWVPDITLDPLGNPHISFVTCDDSSLNYAYKEDGTWHIESVGDSADYGTCIALDSAGNPHIAYISSEGVKIKYATRTAQGWQSPGCISGGLGGFNSISLAPDGNDAPHLVYWNSSTGTLSYAMGSMN